MYDNLGLVVQPIWEDDPVINTDPWDSTPEPEWIRGRSAGEATVDVLRVAKKALLVLEEESGPLDEQQQLAYETLPGIIAKWEDRVSVVSEYADAFTDMLPTIPGIPSIPKMIYKAVASELADPTKGIISEDREAQIVADMGEVYREGGEDLAVAGATQWANVLGDVIDVEWYADVVVEPASYETFFEETYDKAKPIGIGLGAVALIAGAAYLSLMLKR